MTLMHPDESGKVFGELHMRTILKAFFAVAGFAAIAGESAHAGLDSPPPLRFLGLSFNHGTIVHCMIIAVFIYVCVWLLTRGLSRERPRRGQVILELIVNAFLGLSKQTIGPRRGPIYFPYLATLFLFMWCSNMMCLTPIPAFHLGGEPFSDYNNNAIYDAGEPFIDRNGDGVHNPGFQVPKFEEPTTDLTLPLTMAVLFVTILGHGSGIRFNGIGGYLKEYFSPGGIIGVFMFPLNVVGKIAEHVSISFRIFGNIFGGSIIMSVVASLLYYFVIPIGMFGYFGVFAGTIQAFVFTMLATTYISMEAGEPMDGSGE